jgi:hypothetical protein
MTDTLTALIASWKAEAVRLDELGQRYYKGEGTAHPPEWTIADQLRKRIIEVEQALTASPVGDERVRELVDSAFEMGWTAAKDEHAESHAPDYQTARQRTRDALLTAAPVPQDSDVLKRGIKLLEALCEPCDQRVSNDHNWRACRRCLASMEFNEPKKAVVTMLRAVMAAAAPVQADKETR